MQYTPNYNLNKPDLMTDVADIRKLNENADIIDEELHNISLNQKKFFYVDCETESSNRVKEISVSNITELYDGLTLYITFDNEHIGSQGMPKLRINSFDAKYIYNITGQNTELESGCIYLLIYRKSSDMFMLIGNADGMNKNNPNLYGSFSINRKAGTEIGNKSFTCGNQATVSGKNGHGEGDNVTVTAENGHAEGYATNVSGTSGHGEGSLTSVTAANGHGEGKETKVSGKNGHAEGDSTEVSADNAHAEGVHTIASKNGQHVQGKYNVADTDVIHPHIIGWGESNTSRKNIVQVDTNGKLEVSGDIVAKYDGQYPISLNSINSDVNYFNSHAYTDTNYKKIESNRTIKANDEITIKKEMLDIGNTIKFVEVIFEKIDTSTDGAISVGFYSGTTLLGTKTSLDSYVSISTPVDSVKIKINSCSNVAIAKIIIVDSTNAETYFECDDICNLKNQITEINNNLSNAYKNKTIRWIGTMPPNEWYGNAQCTLGTIPNESITTATLVEARILGVNHVITTINPTSITLVIDANSIMFSCGDLSILGKLVDVKYKLS